MASGAASAPWFGTSVTETALPRLRDSSFEIRERENATRSRSFEKCVPKRSLGTRENVHVAAIAVSRGPTDTGSVETCRRSANRPIAASRGPTDTGSVETCRRSANRPIAVSRGPTDTGSVETCRRSENRPIASSRGPTDAGSVETGWHILHLRPLAVYPCFIRVQSVAKLISLHQQLANNVTVNVSQPVVAALLPERQPLVVDPQALQDRGVQVMDMYRVFGNI